MIARGMLRRIGALIAAYALALHAILSVAAPGLTIGEVAAGAALCVDHGAAGDDGSGHHSLPCQFACSMAGWVGATPAGRTALPAQAFTIILADRIAAERPVPPDATVWDYQARAPPA